MPRFTISIDAEITDFPMGRIFSGMVNISDSFGVSEWEVCCSAPAGTSDADLRGRALGEVQRDYRAAQYRLDKAGEEHELLEQRARIRPPRVRKEPERAAGGKIFYRLARRAMSYKREVPASEGDELPF